MENRMSTNRLLPFLPVEVKKAIADALMDVALRDYHCLRDTVLNCRLAGRAFNDAIRGSLFRCVYLSSRFLLKGRRLVSLLVSDPTLLPSIRHIGLTLDESLIQEEADVAATLLSILSHHKLSRIRSFTLVGSCRYYDGVPPDWDHLMGRFGDLERAAVDLMFSPRLSRLEISNFECFPLRHILSSSRTDIQTLRIVNVHSSNQPPSRPGLYPSGHVREPKWRTLELDQDAVRELKWIGLANQRPDARHCLARLKRVDELCVINPDFSIMNVKSDPWSWRSVLLIAESSVRSLTIELNDYTALDLVPNLLRCMYLPYLETFSLTVNVVPDGGYHHIITFRLVTGFIQSFLLNPSVAQALSSPSLSSIVLQINHVGVRFSCDVFHKNLGNHLIKPIFELDPDGTGNRMRYRNVREVVVEIYCCPLHSAPPLHRPGTRKLLRQFSPRKILAVEGTFAADHWDVGLRKVGDVFHCSTSIWTRVVALPLRRSEGE